MLSLALSAAPQLIVCQTHASRAARAPEPHGEEADEGIYERMYILSTTSRNGQYLDFTTCSVRPLTLHSDVLKPRPAMLRQLRQRLREQVPHLARGRLHHAMCRQAHEGISTIRRSIPGAERCHGPRRHARTIEGPRQDNVGWEEKIRTS
jgi:hypothetical protein